MIGKKVELEKEYIREYLGCRDNYDKKVFAIIIDKIRDINKYDTFQGQSHSTNYIYIATDYYLIKILEGENEKVNFYISYLGNIRQIKPSLIKSIID
jgi:hypothetical protein